jgi:hypothetical protein
MILRILLLESANPLSLIYRKIFAARGSPDDQVTLYRGRNLNDIAIANVSETLPKSEVKDRIPHMLPRYVFVSLA